MKTLMLLLVSCSVIGSTISFSLTNQIPSELKLVLAHIESDATTDKGELEKLINDIKIINNFYPRLDKANALFILKSSLYSSILSYKDSNYEQISVKSSDFKIIKTRLNTQITLHSKFTMWLIDQIEDDFKSFIQDNFLDNYETVPLTEVSAKRKQELLRLIRIYSPVIRVYKTYDAVRLSKFNKELALFAISQLANKLPYYKKANLKKINNLELITYNLDSSKSVIDKKNNTLDAATTKDLTIDALKQIEPKSKKEALDLLEDMN